ncbi:MAG: hypothetical protein J4428_01690 [Candidatus Aenigmarchaeota archaeon]|nr:hypothetical protein [Candidatus Aenigmarchaeota archaeon]
MLGWTIQLLTTISDTATDIQSVTYNITNETSAQAQLSCSVGDVCVGTEVLHMSASSNAHAELNNESAYGKKLCCSITEGTLSVDVKDTGGLIALSANANAHAQMNNESSYGYRVDLIASSGPLTCAYANSCAAYDTCLLSISNSTDAHIGDCVTDPYATKLCCSGSNAKKVYASGQLNLSSGWDSKWNTGIGNIGDGNYNFSVSATDIMSHYNSTYVQFTVDNTKPSVNVIYPDKISVNTTFNLNLYSSNSHLNYTKYNVTDSSNVLKQQNSTTLVSALTHTYSDEISMNNYNDGNYTITLYAQDKAGNNRTVQSWFMVDKSGAFADITSPINNSWQSGLTTVTYSTSIFNVKECKWRWRDEAGTWSSYALVTCGSGLTFSFNTTQCNDDSVADCEMELYVEKNSGSIQRRKLR